MLRAAAGPAVSVERFFEASLLGLVASGFLALAASEYLDWPTMLLVGAGLLLRAVLISGWTGWQVSERAATLAAGAYGGFYLVDYLWLSRSFLEATVHLLFFLAVARILTARTGRDHLYTAGIAFLELLAAAILSVNFNFLLFLSLYLVFAIAALTSGEIRRSMERAGAAPGRTVRSGFRRFHLRLAALAVCVSAGILALTACLFLLLPRTADAAFARLMPRRMHLPGFSSQVTLGEIGEIQNLSRPVMHVHVWGEMPGGLKWRGGSLQDFDGKRWTNSGPPPAMILVANGEANLAEGERPPGRGINYDVSYDEVSTDALFFAGIPQSIRVRTPRLLRVEGGYRLTHTPPQGFHYGAYSLVEEAPETAPPPYPPPILPLAVRERCLQLPSLDPRIPALSRELAPPSGTDLERARALERRLRVDYRYTLQLPRREPSDPLADFLFTRRQGHCEYFASAMTVMLRTLGIPARLATGFQSGIYNSLTGLWLVRSSDAHTWVEAWIPRHGWTTFDPTPAGEDTAVSALAARLSLYLDAAETYWQEWVVGYDASQQGTLADRFEQGARGMGLNWFDSLGSFGAGWQATTTAWVRRYGWRMLVVATMAAWLGIFGPPLLRLLRIRRRVRLARKGQASTADATLLYERMLAILKGRGYQKPPWFTPVEFAATLTARSEPLARTVAEFTTSYNALRFGGRAEVAPRLSALLDELQQARR